MDSLLDINNLSFNDSKITIILDDKGEPWFKGKDIGKILEYSNIHKYIQHVDDDDRKQLKEIGVPNLGTLSHNEKNTIYINESGLYSLILSSKKEEAKKFKKWVTSEVLPSIRKHGEYKLKKELESVTNNFQEQLSLKDILNFYFYGDTFYSYLKNIFIFYFKTSSFDIPLLKLYTKIIQK